VVFGALAVTALGVGGVLLLGGSGEAAVDEAPVAAPPAPVAATPSPAASPREAVVPATRSTGRSARNPFQVLLSGPAAAPAGGGSTATAPATPTDAVPTDGVPTDGVPTDAVPEQGVPAGGPGAGAAPVPGGAPTSGIAVPARALALLGVQGTDAARKAVFTVDGARQTVAVADSFGPDGSLLLLSLQEGPEPGQWTAVVQLGQADPFDVVTGQPVALA
jgi:hypothetical protein